MPFAQPQRTGPLAPKMRTHSSTVLSRILDEIEELVEHIAPFRHALKSMPFAQPQRTGPLAPKMRTHSSTVLSRIWEVFAV